MKTRLFTGKLFSLPISAAFVVLYVISLSCNSNHKQTELQQLLYDELSPDMPGIVAAIAGPDQKLFWAGAAGYADTITKEPLSPSNTFRIASVSKTFVAAAILRLWEQDKLRLDDPIALYISSLHSEILRNGGYNPDSITIRQLLNHTSGMADHTHSDRYTPEYMQERHVWTRTEQLEELVRLGKPLDKPGARFSYSDSGYVLLGEIIENLTGQPMGEAIDQLLMLKQLGIANTHMESPDGDFSGQRMHQYHNKIDTYNFHPSLDYFGGGGHLSTAADLAMFYNMLFNNRFFEYTSTLDTMLQPFSGKSPDALDYRYGIWKTEIGGVEAYTHTGFWGTQVAWFPDYKMAIAVNYSQRWANKGPAPIIEKIISKSL
ncbi:MAG: beta-lactamase family protein [Bacteroidia bacterium]|jgi:D-alanyl-D-alanine carboxypeptidase|nr:beta-lactamase family protein [Bacteroidia bacterium]